MKKICAFIFAVAVAVVTPAVLFAAASGDNSYGTVTDYQQVIKVHNEFNAYGIAIKGTTTSTTTTTTTNSKGEKSTTVETVTTESSWHAGSLKPDTSHTVSDTKSSDGSTQHSDFTDTYTYDNNGKLTGASGTGTTTSYDGETKHTTSGTITRSFIIKDGQALFTKQVTSGTTKDKDGKEIGTFSSTTTIAESDYKYLGGSWVPMKQVSTSTSTDKAGNSETITRTTTYNRDANGTITGMSQTATGTKVEITSDKSKKTYTLTDYSVTVKNDPRMGYYIASEDYSWKLNDAADASRTAHDPWTKGTLAIVDGHLALKVDPADVKGDNFYAHDPTLVTGKTTKDKEGNYIFMVKADDPQTEKQLEANVGKQVNLMWQYFTKSSDPTAGGYGWLWLAPTSDARVSYHFKNDNVAKVEQWGGDWNRDSQFVVIP